jgi:PAS domain S-box-containing protein
VDKAGDEIFWADTQGHLVYVNERAAKSLGYERQELVGRSVLDFDADHRPEHWRELLEHLSGQGPLTLETRHRHSSGTIVPKELTMSLVRAGGGDLVFGTGRDIRERKRNEAVLRSRWRHRDRHRAEFFETLTRAPGRRAGPARRLRRGISGLPGGHGQASGLGRGRAIGPAGDSPWPIRPDETFPATGSCSSKRKPRCAFRRTRPWPGRTSRDTSACPSSTPTAGRSGIFPS